MKLYHGSNIAVFNPQIFESDRKLDFGTGFYLTSSLVQAERWAKLTQARRVNGIATVSVFEADEKILSTLNVLHFQKADNLWLKFVTKNRKNSSPENVNYDVVIGPVANDRTMPVISLYFSGIYDANETVKRLLPQKLNDQYTFKTEKSLTALKFIEAKTYDK
ncbi:MAG: DUF3990 domain-containing protein [Treponema sp.]|nr:DUF3990 domain-containing protein [Treponema sp.]